MKKQGILIFSFILSILFLVGCNKLISNDINSTYNEFVDSDGKIILPPIQEINSIEIINGKSKFESNDKNLISKIINEMSTASLTNKAIILVPSENHIEIRLIEKENATILFIYIGNYKLFKSVDKSCIIVI